MFNTDIAASLSAAIVIFVSFNEPFFAGHFPEEPVMPGVLIVEALAQTGAVAILGKDENRGKTAYFASINSAKFKRKVVPGDILTLETYLFFSTSALLTSLLHAGQTTVLPGIFC